MMVADCELNWKMYCHIDFHCLLSIFMPTSDFHCSLSFFTFTFYFSSMVVLYQLNCQRMVAQWLGETGENTKGQYSDYTEDVR